MQFPADELPPLERSMAELVAGVNRIADALEKYVWYAFECKVTVEGEKVAMSPPPEKKQKQKQEEQRQ